MNHEQKLEIGVQLRRQKSLKLTKRDIAIFFAVMVPFLIVSSYLFTVNSDAFKVAKAFIGESKFVAQELGEVVEMSPSFWGKSYERKTDLGSDALYSVKVVGKNSTGRVQVDLIGSDQGWIVQSAKLYKSDSEQAVPIPIEKK